MSLGESVMVSLSFPFGGLSAPRASLRPPALATLTRDMVKVRGTGDIICKRLLLGP